MLLEYFVVYSFAPVVVDTGVQLLLGNDVPLCPLQYCAGRGSGLYIVAKMYFEFQDALSTLLYLSRVVRCFECEPLNHLGPQSFQND